MYIHKHIDKMIAAFVNLIGGICAPPMCSATSNDRHLELRLYVIHNPPPSSSPPTHFFVTISSLMTHIYINMCILKFMRKRDNYRQDHIIDSLQFHSITMSAYKKKNYKDLTFYLIYMCIYIFILIMIHALI